jgi:multidrug efflux pump subunit AcrB
VIEFFLRKRKITLLFFVMIVSIGFLNLFQLPRQEQPDVIVNIAMVTTTYPGSTPEKVEQTVTTKIEQKIKEIQGIKLIQSTSGAGYSSIIIWLNDGEDPKEKWDELRKKVKDVEPDLPEDANMPVINDDLVRSAFYTVNITAESREQLYGLRDTLNSWQDQLQAVPAVADITIDGLPGQEIRVDIDTLKMQHYGITWPQVMAAVKAENERAPIGDLDIGGHNYQLILPESYRWEDLNKVILSRTPEGFPVYLGDVGRAYLTNKKEDVYVYHNGKPAVIMGISVEKGTDVPSLQSRVEELLGSLKKSLPVGVEVIPMYSQSEMFNEMLYKLLREMIIAIAAVLLVCALGLNFVTALMVALAIPVSVAVGMFFLPALGITLNMMTIFALIVVLGILVDDAVVVNDNIERRLQVLRESPYEASVNGSREVAASILTATLATIFSFGPLMFLSGISGEFIRPIPVVVSLTMLASMIMALTIIPIFRHWYETRNGRGAEGERSTGLIGGHLTRLAQWYAGRLMPLLLRRPLRTGLMGVLIGTLAYGLIPFTPVELFPAAKREELPMDIRLPKGADIEQTNAVIQDIQAWLTEQPGVHEVAAIAGAYAHHWIGYSAGLDNVARENAQVVAKVDLDQVNVPEIIESWQSELQQRHPGVSIRPWEIKSGPPVGPPIEFHLYGSDIATLRVQAQQIKEQLAKVPGAYNIKDNFGLDNYTLEFQVNKAMMEQKLVTYADLSRTLRLAGQGLTVSQFDDGKELIDINLYAEKPGHDPLAVFQRLTVPNLLGQQVPLSEIATIKPSFGIQNIPHRNLSRAVTITGDVRGRTATEVMTDVTAILEEHQFPEGYHWEVGGEMTEQTDIFLDMGKLAIVVFFLIFIQIAIQFYSLSLPLLVMSTVYLAAAGSLIGLFITQTPLGFMTVMGIIALAGIVVRNGIVLIDFIEKARANGVELKQAVIQAGEARLRPILLTSMTAVAGLTPLALSGNPLFTPLAVTIISGLIFSTLLTLIVVPSLYTALASYKERRAARRLERGEARAGNI